ncbi:MAG TPA: hypothetical protein VGK00_13180 [Anaerolineales bacterium]|jgi:hypothetical protein
MKVEKCQMQDKETIHEGWPKPVKLSFRPRLTLTLSRLVDPRIKHFIKHRLKLFTVPRTSRNFPDEILSKANVNFEAESYKTGDLVRVRSMGEIRATLNSNNWLRGCKFMPEMEQYCGTTQQIFKPVTRFLNECDYTVRKTRGLVLLENVFCQGVAWAGPCDRSCYYFWRVEWLEALETEVEL